MSSEAPRWSKKLFALLLGGAALSSFFLLVARPSILDWGATDEERVKVLPGDDIVPGAEHHTRAITIDRPIAEVWPWLAQIGQDRGGFYSYELLEDIVGCEMDNADRLLPDRQHWAIGDRLWMYPPSAGIAQTGAPLMAYVPGRALAFATRRFGTPADAVPDGSWAFVLTPVDAGSTRLYVRSSGSPVQTLLGRVFDISVFTPVHFVMERKMMEELKARAEGRAPTPVGDAIQILSWLVTFVVFIGAFIAVLRRLAWRRAFACFVLAGLLFQFLTLVQPGPWLSMQLALFLAIVLWWPASPWRDRPEPAKA